MSKLFELIVARRITAWAEKSRVLAEGHFGGRRGSGTEDALFALEHWVKAKWREGKAVAALFLDVKSAYPSVHPGRLIHYLFQLKCPVYLILIIADFLRGRSTTIRLDDFVSTAFPIEIGLPQGSPLSVILYILYNNSLLNKSFRTSLNTVSIGYVDNVVHLVADQSINVAKDRLEEEGRRSLKWGDSHGAIFNQAKAQFLWLTKRKPPADGFPFGDQILKPVTEVKWLGVWLDSKLLFNKNFRALEEKAHKTMTQLRIFGCSRWGAKEKDRIQLIKSVLFPRVLYGAALWATRPNSGKVAALATKVNRLAGIFSLGVFKLTSNKFILNRSGLPDFLDEVIRTSFSFFFRKLTVIKPNNIIRDFILNSRTDSTAKFADSAQLGLAAEKVDVAMALKPENIYLPFEYGVGAARDLECRLLDTSKEDAINSVKSLISSYDSDPEARVIFSDGSFHPEKGGAGAAVCPGRNVFSSFALGGNTLVSNHESEAAGVLAGLGLANVLSSGTDVRRILLLVDNQGVIRRVNDPTAPKPGQGLFAEIDRALATLPEHLQVTLAWCPGHRDILGNEMADQLAKESLESSSAQHLDIPSNYKKVHRRAVTVSSARLPNPSELHIAFSSLINQLASGHCALKYHLFKICRALDPLCPNCGARETVFHFMNFCPKYRSIRVTLRRNLRSLRIRFKAARLDAILNERKAEVALAKFLQDSQRFPDQFPK
jgi:ribonuclease HI